jgi:type III restriction enzyme
MIDSPSPPSYTKLTGRVVSTYISTGGDRCDQVKHWVRNIVSNDSFRLLTSTDYFYPDFVAELKDGRILVVEYKGAHIEPGEQEKRNIGERWGEKSNGKGLFLWAVKRDERGRDVFKQVEDKVSGK